MFEINNAIYDCCMGKITNDEMEAIIKNQPPSEWLHYILVNAALQKDRSDAIEALIEKHGGETFSKYYSENYVHFAAGGIRL